MNSGAGAGHVGPPHCRRDGRSRKSEDGSRRDERGQGSGGGLVEFGFADGITDRIRSGVRKHEVEPGGAVVAVSAGGGVAGDLTAFAGGGDDGAGEAGDAEGETVRVGCRTASAMASRCGRSSAGCRRPGRGRERAGPHQGRVEHHAGPLAHPERSLGHGLRTAVFMPRADHVQDRRYAVAIASSKSSTKPAAVMPWSAVTYLSPMMRIRSPRDIPCSSAVSSHANR